MSRVQMRKFHKKEERERRGSEESLKKTGFLYSPLSLQLSSDTKESEKERKRKRMYITD